MQPYILGLELMGGNVSRVPFCRDHSSASADLSQLSRFASTTSGVSGNGLSRRTSAMRCAVVPVRRGRSNFLRRY